MKQYRQAYNKVTINYQSGEGLRHFSYTIKDKFSEKRYESKEAMIRGLLDTLTPYLHGAWNKITFDVTAEQEVTKYGTKGKDGED